MAAQFVFGAEQVADFLLEYQLHLTALEFYQELQEVEANLAVPSRLHNFIERFFDAVHDEVALVPDEYRPVGSKIYLEYRLRQVEAELLELRSRDNSRRVSDARDLNAAVRDYLVKLGMREAAAQLESRCDTAPLASFRLDVAEDLECVKGVVVSDACCGEDEAKRVENVGVNAVCSVAIVGVNTIEDPFSVLLCPIENSTSGVVERLAWEIGHILPFVPSRHRARFAPIVSHLASEYPCVLPVLFNLHQNPGRQNRNAILASLPVHFTEQLIPIVLSDVTNPCANRRALVADTIGHLKVNTHQADILLCIRHLLDDTSVAVRQSALATFSQLVRAELVTAADFLEITARFLLREDEKELLMLCGSLCGDLPQIYKESASMAPIFLEIALVVTDVLGHANRWTSQEQHVFCVRASIALSFFQHTFAGILGHTVTVQKVQPESSTESPSHSKGTVYKVNELPAYNIEDFVRPYVWAPFDFWTWRRKPALDCTIQDDAEQLQHEPAQQNKGLSMLAWAHDAYSAVADLVDEVRGSPEFLPRLSGYLKSGHDDAEEFANCLGLRYLKLLCQKENALLEANIEPASKDPAPNLTFLVNVVMPSLTTMITSLDWSSPWTEVISPFYDALCATLTLLWENCPPTEWTPDSYGVWRIDESVPLCFSVLSCTDLNAALSWLERSVLIPYAKQPCEKGMKMQSPISDLLLRWIIDKISYSPRFTAKEFAAALVRRLEPYYEGQSEERLMVAETLVCVLDMVLDYQSHIVPLLAEAVEIDFDVADIACERAPSLSVFRDWAHEHIRRKRFVNFNPSLEPDLPMPTLPRASRMYIGHDGLLVSESVPR